MSKPDHSNLTPENIIPFIEDIFERRGGDEYLGEQVTMSEHMLQAAQLAERADAEPELVAAALLHDIGHFTSEFPADAVAHGVDNIHEEAGAKLIATFFPQLVTSCVRWHVAAKRYLCATDPDYFARLSSASVGTLKLQGGPMDASEVAAFRDQPFLDAILKVRLWDDHGKVAGMSTPPFSHYKPMLEGCVRACT